MRPTPIEIDGARCSIELTIRDLKQPFGLGDYQCTTTLAILRFVPLACLAFCLWRLTLIENLNAGWLQVAAARVSLPEAPLSFQRVRRALRAWATRRSFLPMPCLGRTGRKSSGIMSPCSTC